MKCRICQKPRSRFLQIPVPKKGALGVHFSSHTVPFSLFHCEDCHFLFAAEKKTPASSQSFSYLNDPELSRFRKSLLPKILRQRQDAQRFIDVGGADGSFVALFQGQGRKLFCLDPYAPDLKLAKKRGLITFQQKLSSSWAKKKRGQFDVALCTQLLEHCPRPRLLLKNLREILSPSGLLYLEVPSLEWIIEEKQNCAFIPEHINYFSLSSLVKILGNEWKLLEAGRGFGEQYNWLLAAPAWPKEMLLFQQETQLLGQKLLEFCREQKKQGETLVMWGAGGKGKSLLAQNPELSSLFTYIIDGDHKKSGQKLLGTPVYLPPMIRKRPPSVILLSALTYAAQIKRELHELGWQGQLLELSSPLKISSFGQIIHCPKPGH